MRIALHRLLIATTAFSACTVAAGAERLDHCKSDEIVYFSCRVGTSKIMSLCGGEFKDPQTHEVNKDMWLQYRFGKLGALEFVFPSNTKDSLSHFEGEFRRGLGVSLTTVNFKNNGVSYSVGSTYSSNTEYSFTGVEVTKKGERQPTRIPCRNSPNSGMKFNVLVEYLDPASHM